MDFAAMRTGAFWARPRWRQNADGAKVFIDGSALLRRAVFLVVAPPCRDVLVVDFDAARFRDQTCDLYVIKAGRYLDRFGHGIGTPNDLGHLFERLDRVETGRSEPPRSGVISFHRFDLDLATDPADPAEGDRSIGDGQVTSPQIEFPFARRDYDEICIGLHGDDAERIVVLKVSVNKGTLRRAESETTTRDVDVRSLHAASFRSEILSRWRLMRARRGALFP
jgi:hypothetical protein